MEEDKQEIEGVTASVAAAVEISLDAAVVDVFITTGRHFPIKEEPNGTERLFSWWKEMFLSSFGKSFA